MSYQDNPIGLFRKDHPDTSREAAVKADTGTQRAMVLAYLEGAGQTGATDEQIQTHLSMNPSTQRPRRVELVRAGRVVDSGDRRKTRTGRKAIVWRVT